MLAVAVGWQLYALTGRAIDLGLVGLGAVCPGAGADRCPSASWRTAATAASSVACCQGIVAVLAPRSSPIGRCRLAGTAVIYSSSA